MMRGLHVRAQRVRTTLWTVVLPPSVWALHFLFAYLYAAVRCAKAGAAATIGDVRVAIAIATVVALLVVAALGFVAWAQMRIEGDPPPHQDSTDEDRVRFLAIATLLLAGLSFVAIVYTALPAVLFGDCR